MPDYVKHRMNRATELAGVDPAWGVEIDLRSDPSRPGHIYLAHDPWVPGDSLELWLTAFVKRGIYGPVILNTKEDGLEAAALETMARAGITNFFFLDTALPTLVRWTLREGERRFAVRLSSVEPVESVRTFAGRADWLWVDCFDGEPIAPSTVAALRDRFKICLVSPELQGQPIGRIGSFRELAAVSDLICTKVPDEWRAQTKPA